MSQAERAASETQNIPVPIWASNSINGDVTQILPALEEGIPITLITSFDLITCELDDPMEEVLSRSDLQGFDYIPVRDESESVVGVLVHQDALKPNEPVRAVMRQLHPSMLISADASLLSFVAEVDQTPFCLVVRGREIAGIVTLSDLQKLPVRPVLFMLITSVELLLAEWLRQNYPNEEDWLCKVEPNRRPRIEKKWQDLQKSNMAIDRISTTDFRDKRDAALNLGAFSGLENEAKRKLEAIGKLRNSVAHAGDYALTPTTAKDVAQTVRWARELIHMLQSQIMSNQSQTN
ncbi:hypothetical protein H6F86_16645 [Phormidium sp. FACHB-592]|uniref:CBS domain-containing protein n=1 Tax=Stenomitos frigidus AS-A4 TaxID=2933935 RepID=A0ABV0KPB3_9CYAN|nr:hypothetical protein [Phormidium sp. FACHB-592]MBD2075494.1 hypothetical protein [Phormidium sp. FACHB-592]